MNSQFGEDRWIVENLRIPEKGMFVDVGANDGITFSNSLHFENIGWNGVLIEPEPGAAYACSLKRDWPLVQAAIDAFDGIGELYVAKESAFSSLLRNDDWPRVKIDCYTLDSIVKYFDLIEIDILSIDTEGTERTVWNSLTLIRPKIIIVEYFTFGLRSMLEEVKAMADAKSYLVRHQTECNLILETK